VNLEDKNDVVKCCICHVDMGKAMKDVSPLYVRRGLDQIRSVESASSLQNVSPVVETRSDEQSKKLI
jgi:hypothetical protein